MVSSVGLVIGKDGEQHFVVANATEVSRSDENRGIQQPSAGVKQANLSGREKSNEQASAMESKR